MLQLFPFCVVEISAKTQLCVFVHLNFPGLKIYQSLASLTLILWTFKISKQYDKMHHPPTPYPNSSSYHKEHPVQNLNTLNNNSFFACFSAVSVSAVWNHFIPNLWKDLFTDFWGCVSQTLNLGIFYFSQQTWAFVAKWDKNLLVLNFYKMLRNL